MDTKTSSKVELSDVKPSISFSEGSWCSRRTKLEKRLLVLFVLALIVAVALAAVVGYLLVKENKENTGKVVDITNETAQPQCSSNPCPVSGESNGTTHPQCSSYPCLVFEDNFDTFNFDVWEHEISAAGGGNWEFQYYHNNRSNSYVKDGKLFIKPTLTADKYGEQFLATGVLDLWGYVANDVCTGNMFYGCRRQGDGVHYVNPIQSARLRSIRGFNMKYGKLEVEAKMPKGDWIWPAIWLLPKWNRYGQWPASGEIDLCESRGNEWLVNENNQSVGVNAMGSTLHFGPDYLHNGWTKAHQEKILPSGSFADGFHKFVLEWDENGLRTIVDGDEVLNVIPDDGGFFKLGEFEKQRVENPWRNSNSKMAPFDQEFYIILNVAVGGTHDYWPDTFNGKPWSNVGETASKDFWNARGDWLPTWNPDKNDGEDAAMQVNYVRYWKLKP